MAGDAETPGGAVSGRGRAAPIEAGAGQAEGGPESVSDSASPTLRRRMPALDSAIRALARDAAALGKEGEAGDELGRRVERAMAGVCASAAGGPRAAGAGPPVLEVEARVSERELRLSVADHGAGPGWLSRTPGLETGLPQLAGYSDALEVRGHEGGAVIELRFRLLPRAPAAGSEDGGPTGLGGAGRRPVERPAAPTLPAPRAAPVPRAPSPIQAALRELAGRGRPEAAAELRLLAELLGDSPAPVDVLRALELAAEATRAAVNAATVAVSRWEPDHDALRTLVNVGELAPGEQRFPVCERYPLAAYPVVDAQLKRGRPYLWGVGDGIEEASERLLIALGKAYEAGVPITVAGALWGELWAARGGVGRRFDRHDLALLQVAAQLVSAILARHEPRPTAAAPA